MLWLFGKNKKKSSTQTPKVEKKILHNHNLDKWHYLGFLELKLDESVYPVFLFVDKNDHSKRSYTITGVYPDLARKYHPYVTKYIDPWTTGEYELYTFSKSPSKWLKEYMLEKFSSVWDNKTEWWVSNDNAKYQSAQKKQTSKKTPPNQGSGAKKDPVVVQVDFGKKKDED